MDIEKKSVEKQDQQNEEATLMGVSLYIKDVVLLCFSATSNKAIATRGDINIFYNNIYE